MVLVAGLGFSFSSSSLLSESSEEDSVFLVTTTAGLVGGGTLVLVSGSLSDSEELSLLDSFFLTCGVLAGGLTGVF